MNAAYASYLAPPYPSRACVEVSHIGDDAGLEIVAIALAGPVKQTTAPTESAAGSSFSATQTAFRR